MVKKVMQIYSETTFAFIAKAQKYLIQIIQNETKLSVARTRFHFNNYKYPISIITFTGIEKIGYFDPSNYQIGLNVNLVYSVKEEVLKDILRHEFAHYLTFLNFGNVIPHGTEFKSICKELGWEKSISKASMDIETENLRFQSDIKTEKMMIKIKNLLDLGQSDNENEAKLATAKANSLMLKYNLDIAGISNDEALFVKVIFTSKKRNSKLNTLYSIISHFLVTPVLNYTNDGVKLEIAGSRANINIGSYICDFLDKELDRSWAIAKYKNNLKGLKQKNSFFMGLAKGFDLQMQASSNSMTKEESKELTIIKADLADKTNRIYGRLKSSHSGASIDKQSMNLGKKIGKSLTIKKALDNKKTKQIGWIK